LICACDSRASENVMLPNTSFSCVCAVFDSADCRSSTSYTAFITSRIRKYMIAFTSTCTVSRVKHSCRRKLNTDSRWSMRYSEVTVSLI
jgi:hypothetical protein